LINILHKTLTVSLLYLRFLVKQWSVSN